MTKDRTRLQRENNQLQDENITLLRKVQVLEKRIEVWHSKNSKLKSA